MTRVARKDSLLAQLRAAIEQEPSERRSATITDLSLELTEHEPGTALRVVWNELWPTHDDDLLRVLSFVMAKRAEVSSASLWPALSCFLASPTLTDTSTILNVVTALQLIDPAEAVAEASLRFDLDGFLLRCFEGNELSVEAAADLVVRFGETGALLSCLSKKEAVELKKAIARCQETTHSAASELKEAADMLASSQFRAALDLDTTPIQRAIEQLAVTAGSSPWVKAEQLAMRATRSAFQDLLLAYELQAQASIAGAQVQQLRLVGEKTESGRVEVGILEKLLRSWPDLFQSIYGDLRPGKTTTPRIPMYALATAAGSFVIRLALDEEADKKTVAKAFQQALALLEGRNETAGAPSAAVKSVQQVLADEDLDLSIAIADPTQRVPRARSVVYSGAAARRLRSVSAAAVERTETELDLTGTLEGANHRTGRVDIGLTNDGVQCDTPADRRAALLNKVIGKQYVFRVRKKTDHTDAAARSTLLSIEPLSGDAAIQGATTVEDETFSGPLTSDLVPQQDRLDRIVQIVSLLREGKAVGPANMQMPDTKSSRRHVDYMRHAAKILHIISDRDELLPAGRTLARLPARQAIELLMIQFQTSHVGHAWLEWAGKTDVRELESKSAFDFLRARSRLSTSMIGRRGRTLKKWVEIFRDQSAAADDEEVDEEED